MIHFKLFSLIDILFFTLLFCLECWCQNSISRHERENILTWEGGWKRGWNLSCFNYCLWWELGNWQFWPDYPCLSLHWDYRRQVLLWAVLPVCNWDPGWQTFVRPATLAGLGGDRYLLSIQVLRCLLSSPCVATLSATTSSLHPYGLWGWVLWVTSWHLQNGPSLTCLGAELLFAHLLERKGWDVACLAPGDRQSLEDDCW